MNINIRTKSINNTTYYAAKDILTVFDLSGYLLKRYVSPEDKFTAKFQTSSGMQSLTVINAHAVNILSQHSKLPQEKIARILDILHIGGTPSEETKLTTFTSPEFGQIRTVVINEEPWFVGKDVAEVLGYIDTDQAIRMHVDKGDKSTRQINGNNNTPQNMIIINESGLYSLILSSKLPSAERFKRWVTSEVLPTIRKTGGYVHNDDLFIDTYLPFADKSIQSLFKATLLTIREQNDLIRKQQTQLAEQEPKVAFANHVGSSDSLISMAEMSQILAKNDIKIGTNRLFEFLREQKVLIRRKARKNYPYQKYIDRGYFQVVEKVRYDSIEGNILYRQTYVTGKGQQFIYNLVNERYSQAA